MRIGLVLDDSLDKADGVQQYVLTLGRWFAHHGHEVHYLVGQTERQDIPKIHSLSKNIRAHFNQNRMSTPLPADRSMLTKLLKDLELHVLHVQMPYSPFLAGRLIKLAPAETAIIGTFHTIPFSRLESLATKALRLALKRSLKRFDAIYSVSKPAQRFAKKSFHVRTNVLPNAVNLSHFQIGKKLRKFDDGKLNIVFLGRLVERKGCLQLLKALALLNEKHQLERIRVLICGKGPLQPKLERFVAANHLQRIVKFVGFISEDEKPNYLASADIAIFPSLGGESFGIVLIEAMAAGTQAVLAGNNPGYKSVMARRSQQLFNPKDEKAVAKILGHYIKDYRARRSAHNWQRAHVEQFDVRVVGNELLKTYRTAIANRKSMA